MASQPQQVPLPRLQNVVATFEMGRSIQLQQLVLLCPFVHYTPKRFAAGVIRLRDPKTTCLVFASGKAVCTGATTEQFAQMASLKFVMLLQSHGADVQFFNFKVQNIVSAAHCNFRVDLNKLSDTVNGFCSYEPALFPGLMYRVQVPANPGSKPNLIVFIVFQSGKCVITGGKNRTQIVAVWTKFFTEILLTYRTQVNYGNSGNYRMCQLSQKQYRDLDKLRAIAHMRTNLDKSSLLLDAKTIASEKWKGHTWVLTDPMQMELLQILEPELYAKHLQPCQQGELVDFVSPERQAQIDILKSVNDPKVQQVLQEACSSPAPCSSKVREKLKHEALYAWPQCPDSVTSVTPQAHINKKPKIL